jgi:hypothetical protein
MLFVRSHQPAPQGGIDDGCDVPAADLVGITQAVDEVGGNVARGHRFGWLIAAGHSYTLS